MVSRHWSSQPAWHNNCGQRQSAVYMNSCEYQIGLELGGSVTAVNKDGFTSFPSLLPVFRHILSKAISISRWDPKNRSQVTSNEQIKTDHIRPHVWSCRFVFALRRHVSKVNLFRWEGFCTAPDTFDRVWLHAWAPLMSYNVELPSEE